MGHRGEGPRVKETFDHRAVGKLLSGTDICL